MAKDNQVRNNDPMKYRSGKVRLGPLNVTQLTTLLPYWRIPVNQKLKHKLLNVLQP